MAQPRIPCSLPHTSNLLYSHGASAITTSPSSPLTLTFLLLLADNVGDNVGDIAGMGADLFGSFAESTCAALVISSVSTLGTEHVYVAMCYPLLISAVGILVCLLTTIIATDLKPARGISDIQSTLKWQLVIATVLATPVSALHLQSVSALHAAFSACLLCKATGVRAITTPI